MPPSSGGNYPDTGGKLEKVKVHGTIETADGKPIPEGLKFGNVYVRRPRASIGSSLSIREGVFEGEVTPGRIWISFDASGYAPSFLGPFDKGPGEELNGLRVILDPGFPVKIRIVDEEDRPIAGVSCRAAYLAGNSSVRRKEIETDEEGEIFVENATGDADLQVSMRGPGYQFDHRDLRLARDVPFVLRLQKARPTEGRIATEKGEPIRGAKVRLASRQGFDPFVTDPRGTWAREAYPAWSTDGEGRFCLDSLRDDCTYAIWVEAPERGPVLIENVKAGTKGVDATLRQPIVVSCRITGGLERIRRDRGGEATGRLPESDQDRRYDP